jgi:hypothetical protein
MALKIIPSGKIFKWKKKLLTLNIISFILKKNRLLSWLELLVF